MMEAAIVIQGPYVKTHTERSIRIFLERNPPNVLIIVSTNIINKDLLSPFEKEIIVLKRGPYVGRLIYIFSEIPIEKDFHKTNFSNQNLQRLTSFAGIQHAQSLGIPLVLKCRSDAFLGRENICQYLKTFLESHPPIIKNGERIKGRIIVSDQTKVWKENVGRVPNLGHQHIADYWFFGYTQDLIRYFDMSPGCSWNAGKGIETKFAPETNLALCWMKNIGIKESSDILNLAKDFLIILSNIDVEFVWLKHWHKYEQYIFYRQKHLEEAHKDKMWMWKLFTHERWRDLIAF